MTRLEEELRDEYAKLKKSSETEVCSSLRAELQQQLRGFELATGIAVACYNEVLQENEHLHVMAAPTPELDKHKVLRALAGVCDLEEIAYLELAIANGELDTDYPEEC